MSTLTFMMQAHPCYIFDQLSCKTYKSEIIQPGKLFCKRNRQCQHPPSIRQQLQSKGTEIPFTNQLSSKILALLSHHSQTTPQRTEMDSTLLTLCSLSPVRLLLKGQRRWILLHSSLTPLSPHSQTNHNKEEMDSTPFQSHFAIPHQIPITTHSTKDMDSTPLQSRSTLSP